MSQKIKIAASILAANPMRFESEIKKVERAGIDLIHIDVMDGHFVPNITMGPFIIKGIKKITKVPLDIHLMITHPERYIKAFAAVAGKDDFITFHIEATKQPKKVISLIKKAGLKAGVSLNPNTKTKSIEKLLSTLDLVLIMSVYPGFDGQKFMPEVLPKISRLRILAPDGLEIAIDGGITPENIPQVIKRGANIIAAASAIFKTEDPYKAVKTLKEIAKQAVKKTSCMN
ncbi:MAG TPA: ribulose-phosphate 3-epimerase [Candidatus Wujingus californicus]|uniref:ribulose-phosphate 3-epimerase n=1 Tax=Candidatus Wujingus californicus TaxID=3367618 RepID=UPI001D2C4FC3|nr:ribulose-phosphate 3-epimerase [Planctomycetota bacterium]MDO8131419.1 ribulose-phosphate 3-epimerase [Candidatus Brocadiales bacterium]